MACTTILVGKGASYNGSTMMARNDDSGAGSFTAKKWVVSQPSEQAAVYRSVLSGVKIPLPGNPISYTACPNVLPGQGLWEGAGINAANVAMTATETISSNPRVLGADPLLKRPDKDGAADKEAGIGGIGEEDLVTLTLPYIRSAREGVERIGELLRDYGTYEMNGIGISDSEEVWWLETIGGHHFIAKRVPDDCCVIMPNQLGIDEFDLVDALGEQREHICSPDLLDFIRSNHLNLSMDENFEIINPRHIFGSHDDADHVYNTPRAWYMGKRLCPVGIVWEGEDADFTPESDDIPWALVPEMKLTPEEIKYLLSSHYQGTAYDPYGSYGDAAQRGKYRSIGINRNDFMALLEIRGYAPSAYRSIEWISFGSNAFNTMAPFYANVTTTPEYLSETGERVSTESFYWVSRMIAALADASYKRSLMHIERYEEQVLSMGHRLIREYDERQARALEEAADSEEASVELLRLRHSCNREMAEQLRSYADKTLSKVLYEQSNNMKNQYARSDA